MKLCRFRFLATLLILVCAAPTWLCAQDARPAKKSVAELAAPGRPATFAPLDRWKTAVAAGNHATLSSLYSAVPPAKAKTPQGETQDPAAEPSFWASLRGAGLRGLNVKVLESKTQPGMRALVLRVEGALPATSVMLQNSKQPATGPDRPVVISLTQIWARQGTGWRIISSQRGNVGAAAAMRLPEPARPNTQLYPAAEEAPREIAAALRAAATDHKRVILVFGGNWCYDCHVLDATLRSRKFAPIVNAGYHVVHVNVGDYDKNLDLAKKYEIPLEKGVPSLAVIDADGKLIVSQKKGEFESTARIGPEDILEFLQRWKP